MEETQTFKTPISTEDGRNYNMTWNQNGKIVSSNNIISEERWPFPLPNENEEQFNARIERLKKQK
jgi:YD repeat-containing protein